MAHCISSVTQLRSFAFAFTSSNIKTKFKIPSLGLHSLSSKTNLISSPFSNFTPSACLSTQQQEQEPQPQPQQPPFSRGVGSGDITKWKPMCLYHTHGKCTMMDDPLHLAKFTHSCKELLEGNITKSAKLQSQPVDFLLVLDLEGKVEIIEFPVMMIDAKTMEVVDLFHRFVRPSKMSEQRIGEYIEGKYGKIGVDRVWHDTAMPFRDVLGDFEAWMTNHQLWRKEPGGALQRAAFATCGNWDIKTKIPEQCKVSGLKLPSYFMEWINLKDVYLNFYNRRASGMRTMLNELKIPLLGSHHLGIDDTRNITKVLQRMLADGALMQITARRNLANPETVEFLFKNRIR